MRWRRSSGSSERERCPYALIGELTAERDLVVVDDEFGNEPVAMPLDVLFGKPPKMTREASPARPAPEPWDRDGIDLGEAVKQGALVSRRGRQVLPDQYR